MRPMTIYVDLDDTVLDWNGHLDYRLSCFEEMRAVPRAHERTSWDLFADLTDRQRRRMRHILNEPTFYSSLGPLPGAVDGIRRLRELGNEVFFLTTPYPSNPNCADGKYKSVEKWFGQTMRNRTVLTHDKTIVRGDVLIDDRPVIEGSVDEPDWARIIFDQPWNQGVGGTRLRSWSNDAVDLALMDAVIWR